MAVQWVSVSEVATWLEQGYRVIDIRPVDEYRREHIVGSQNMPIEQLTEDSLRDEKVIFACLSGMRTQANAQVLAASVASDVLILEGGLKAWKAAGLAVNQDAKQPLPLMRQVQIVAGCLVWMGVFLGVFVSSWFFMVPAFVGLGLTFAGATGWCGMALLLMKMPWNRMN